MIFKEGSRHKLSFIIQGRELFFDATIIAVEGDIISFRDKYGDVLNFNLRNLGSSKELNGEEDD